MLKEQLFIFRKQAENLIYDMTRYADNRFNAKNLTNEEIKQWFEKNRYEWRRLIENARTLKTIPLVENLIDYEFSLQASKNTSVTIYQSGHETAKLVGPGQLNVFNYHSRFIKALEERGNAVKKNSYADLLSCITHAIASVELYINSKINLWNQNNKQSPLSLESHVKLDEKLNGQLFTMCGYRMNQLNTVWNHFIDLKNLNNEIFKHNATGSDAASYNKMAQIINKFRTGIAMLLFKLHQLFKEPVPSKIIRGVYLPDVYYENS